MPVTDWKTPGAAALHYYGSGSPIAPEVDYTSVVAIDGNTQNWNALVGDTNGFYFYVSNFGFVIPTGESILGIELEVYLKASGTNVVEDNIFVATGPLEANYSAASRGTGAPIPTSYTTFTYGGASDTFGTTYSEAQVEASSFGAAIQYFSASGGRSVDVDRIRMRVHYSGPVEHSISDSLVFTQTLAVTPVSERQTVISSSLSFAETVNTTAVSERQTVISDSLAFAGTINTYAVTEFRHGIADSLAFSQSLGTIAGAEVRVVVSDNLALGGTLAITPEAEVLHDLPGVLAFSEQTSTQVVVFADVEMADSASFGETLTTYAVTLVSVEITDSLALSQTIATVVETERTHSMADNMLFSQTLGTIRETEVLVSMQTSMMFNESLAPTTGQSRRRAILFT